jgi:hypothetical protein
MDGWNSASGDAFAAPFAEECDFIAFRRRQPASVVNEP